MTSWWEHTENAVAEAIGRQLDTGPYEFTWSAVIGRPRGEAAVEVTGHVYDGDAERAEAAVTYMAARLGSAVNHVDGMVETVTVLDGMRVVIWGVCDGGAFDVLAQRLLAAGAERDANSGSDAYSGVVDPRRPPGLAGLSHVRGRA